MSLSHFRSWGRVKVLYFALLLALPVLLPTGVHAQVSADFSAGGGILVGTSTTTCNAGAAGAIRYSSTLGTIEICDGAGWARIVASSCDNAAAFFSFTELTDQSTSTLVTSNIAAITGLDSGCNVTVGVSGASGSPEYRVCSTSNCSSVTQDWTGANNTLDMQGAYLQLRATTSGSTATTFTITADVGPVSSDWDISTQAADCSLSAIGTVCADGSVYAGTSPDGNVPMYVTRCDVGMTYSGGCTNARANITYNDGFNNYTNSAITDCGSAPACGTSGEDDTATLVATDASTVAGTQVHAAPSYCDNLTMHGKTDWYLPSILEMDVIHTNRVAIGGFDSNGIYQSSSEQGSDRNWKKHFSNGAYEAYYKDYGGNPMRCARQ